MDTRAGGGSRTGAEVRAAPAVRRGSAGVVEVISGRTVAATRPPDEKVAGIAGIFLDFTTKLAEAARLLDLSMICLDFEFPGSGTLTRLEWISFYVFHTQRHIAQLHRIYAWLRKQDAPVAQ